MRPPGFLVLLLAIYRSPVIAVSTAEGWISKPDREGTCTVDWVHPNPKGDAHIAARVFAAIRPWLDRQDRD